MFKTYEKYIVRSFINKFLTISLIFFSLIVLLSILEEISFFKNTDVNFIISFDNFSWSTNYFLKFFLIFLISTQFLFYDLIKKDELNLFKINGLSNMKIIKILSILSFIIEFLPF